jgi:hypothetical protein
MLLLMIARSVDYGVGSGLDMTIPLSQYAEVEGEDSEDW